RQDFVYRERTLEQVRAGLYESGTIVRDYVLQNESVPKDQDTIRAELQSIHNETAAALRACIAPLPAGKLEPFQHLAAELEDYWTKVGRAFALGAQATMQPGNSALHADVLSQHTEILKITREVSAVNDTERKEAEGRIADISVQFRRRLLIVA